MTTGDRESEDWWDAGALSKRGFDAWCSLLTWLQEELSDALGTRLQLEAPKTHHGGDFMTTGFVGDPSFGDLGVRLAGLLTVSTHQRETTHVEAVLFVFAADKRLAHTDRRGDYCVMRYERKGEAGPSWQEPRWYDDEYGEYEQFDRPGSVLR